MKIGIIADIHSNLEALRAVLKDLKEHKIKTVINCGDIVGYGPDPALCMDMVMAMSGYKSASLSPEDEELAAGFNVVNIMGNHDAGVINFTDISCFNRNAYEALLWTKEQMDGNHFSFLKGLKYKTVYENAAICHSTPNNTRNWYYLDSIEMARESFSQNREILFVGHTHKPYVYSKKLSSGKVTGTYPGNKEMELDGACSYIINPGSVGQPRDGNFMPSYMIWDSGRNTIKMHRCDYDVTITQKRLAATPLPYILGERLLLGK